MGDKCVQRLTHKDNEDSVKTVFGELGLAAQFIEAEFFFQVGVDIIDDGINAADASLFNRPADNLGIHDIFILLQTHQFMQMLSVNEAEHYCAEPGGSAVKIYVLTYKGCVCSGNNPLALLILCKILLQPGEIGDINQPDRGRVHHLLGPDGTANIIAVYL